MSSLPDAEPSQASMLALAWLKSGMRRMFEGPGTKLWRRSAAVRSPRNSPPKLTSVTFCGEWGLGLEAGVGEWAGRGVGRGVQTHTFSQERRLPVIDEVGVAQAGAGVVAL